MTNWSTERTFKVTQYEKYGIDAMFVSSYLNHCNLLCAHNEIQNIILNRVDKLSSMAGTLAVGGFRDEDD